MCGLGGAQQTCRVLCVSDAGVQGGEAVEDEPEVQVIPKGLREAETSLKQPQGPLVFTFFDRDCSEVVEGDDIVGALNVVGAVGFASVTQAFGDAGFGTVVVALTPGEDATIRKSGA